LWDYLAGWYAVETGLDNSTLLVPLEGEHSDYLAINNARWDESLPVVMFRQLSKKTFWTYVLANLEANRVGAMPILYRRAERAERSRRPAPMWAVMLGALGLGAGLIMRRMRRAAPRRVPAPSMSARASTRLTSAVRGFLTGRPNPFGQAKR
jgi:hypothetical protein